MLPTQIVIGGTLVVIDGMDAEPGFGKLVGAVKPSITSAGEVSLDLALAGRVHQLLARWAGWSLPPDAADAAIFEEIERATHRASDDLPPHEALFQLFRQSMGEGWIPVGGCSAYWNGTCLWCADFSGSYGRLLRQFMAPFINEGLGRELRCDPLMMRDGWFGEKGQDRLRNWCARTRVSA